MVVEHGRAFTSSQGSARRDEGGQCTLCAWGSGRGEALVPSIAQLPHTGRAPCLAKCPTVRVTTEGPSQGAARGDGWKIPGLDLLASSHCCTTILGQGGGGGAGQRVGRKEGARRPDPASEAGECPAQGPGLPTREAKQATASRPPRAKGEGGREEITERGGEGGGGKRCRYFRPRHPGRVRDISLAVKRISLPGTWGRGGGEGESRPTLSQAAQHRKAAARTGLQNDPAVLGGPQS